jgi:hypothetical protein
MPGQQVLEFDADQCKIDACVCLLDTTTVGADATAAVLE